MIGPKKGPQARQGQAERMLLRRQVGFGPEQVGEEIARVLDVGMESKIG